MTITPLHDPDWRGFASDNYAGVHPEVLTALAAANGGHQVAYGEDRYTARLREVVREHFGERAEVFPVFNGTGANVISLTSVLPRWGAVIAASTAHINTDEAGAPERMTGIKLLTVAAPDGKLTAGLIAREAWGWGNEHRAQPLAVSITQTTELGTLYRPEELRSITDFAHAHGMAVHMDGSRLWNAGAALGVPFREFTTDAGVDVLSLGGTKNGLLGVEAVVVLDPDRATGLRYLRKLTMQLTSKMRFASAQLLALFDDDLGVRSAAHANAMAARLRAALEDGLADGTLSGVAFTQDTDANAIFATLPTDAADRIRERVRFYDWDRSRGEVRWMTSWDTTEADVERFVSVVREELGRG
ncbi:threonine aldolase family protein [Mycolicibacterium litorale]|uniref:Threonine aldolase n=1 Tax=Mycolicibacterium litorale TaxID=758802 RepID=A0AAD1IMR9_9MYCO|nr:low specificity L-threonine aldolase [Mycolicibacterium litorale]MCV7417512.1 low specificity L-threonine aldolase [Mycolicibacterium litorale]TDX99971.1 L-threonine aldolase [Mycolicibacterium litorale]BBY18737.1 threonine aldolase [Mycolicibacterium litorale]